MQISTSLEWTRRLPLRVLRVIWHVSTVMVAGLILMGYFLFIRPMKQKEQEARNMIQSIKENDRVITIGGIHGTITKVKDDRVVLRVADGIHFERSAAAVASLQKSAEGD